MTKSHRVSAVVFCCSMIGFVSINGCAPTSKPQQYRSSFLPPAPRVPEAPEAEPLESQPPSVSKEFIRELPKVLPNETAMAKGSEIDSRLHRADERFEAGKKAYQEGNVEDARRSFDQAVDILLGAPDGAPDRAKLERRLDQMVDTIYRYDVNGLGAAEDGDKVVFDKSPLQDILEMTFPVDPRLKPKVSEEVHATASQIPLDENDSVLSYIHFFSSGYGKRILTAGLKRAGRYQPMIRRILDEEGVPQELIYLAQAESGFLPRAVSYKAAAGMWQFLEWRGKQYDLQVTRVNDERLDPEKATRAAARHLRDLYHQFGDWNLAMAAYNCGPGCVDRAVSRTGYADFWALRNLNMLPQQTQNYVPAILAITIMAKNAKDYGLEDIEPDKPIVYDTVRLNASTNLPLVADAVESPVSEIRELNPALLKGVAPEGYELRVPKGTGHTLQAALDSIPASRRATARMHRVEKGETLAAIAKRYRTAATMIASVNNTSAVAPEQGDVLLIPAAYQDNESHAAKRITAKPQPSRGTARTSTSKTSTRNVSAHRPSSKVLNRKAPAHRVKTASAASNSAGGE